MPARDLFTNKTIIITWLLVSLNICLFGTQLGLWGLGITLLSPRAACRTISLEYLSTPTQTKPLKEMQTVQDTAQILLFKPPLQSGNYDILVSKKKNLVSEVYINDPSGLAHTKNITPKFIENGTIFAINGLTPSSQLYAMAISFKREKVATVSDDDVYITKIKSNREGLGKPVLMVSEDLFIGTTQDVFFSLHMLVAIGVSFMTGCLLSLTRLRPHA